MTLDWGEPAAAASAYFAAAGSGAAPLEAARRGPAGVASPVGPAPRFCWKPTAVALSTARSSGAAWLALSGDVGGDALGLEQPRVLESPRAGGARLPRGGLRVLDDAQGPTSNGYLH